MTSRDNRSIRCHKCRHVLVENMDFAAMNNRPCDSSCPSYDKTSFIHLLEDKLPDWIKVKVEQEQWTKGKLHCENCNSKVGSFDFVSGRKCDCENTLLPSVHFISSQVDRPFTQIPVSGLS